VRQRELEVLGEQLPDVGPLDVVRLGQFDDFDDLQARKKRGIRTKFLEKS
jgi:hypothetical protein